MLINKSVDQQSKFLNEINAYYNKQTYSTEKVRCLNRSLGGADPFSSADDAVNLLLQPFVAVAAVAGRWTLAIDKRRAVELHVTAAR